MEETTTIGISFKFVNPLDCDRLNVRWEWDKIPSVVGGDGRHFAVHSSMPCWVPNRFSVGARFTHGFDAGDGVGNTSDGGHIIVEMDIRDWNACRGARNRSWRRQGCSWGLDKTGRASAVGNKRWWRGESGFISTRELSRRNGDQFGRREGRCERRSV